MWNKGRRQKIVVVLGVVHQNMGWGGQEPNHNFWSKNYHFLFLFPFELEASKKCKSTKQLFNLYVFYPYLGGVKDRLSSWLSVQSIILEG